MKIVAVIPARYKSSRFEGKPLADILGKPMIWWVYQQIKKSDKIDEIYVATDDVRIENTCKKFDMNVIMTSDKHEMMLERIWEVSEKVKADIYVSVAGDEPLIEPDNINKVLEGFKDNKIDVVNLKTKINNPVDIVNWTTMKVVTNDLGFAVFASRSPIPYPKATTNITYYKHMGTYALKKSALDFFKNTKRGILESIEDFDLLRFIEHGKNVKIEEVQSSTISVDTPKDLKRVINIIKEREKKG